jgi:hypothetical protein
MKRYFLLYCCLSQLLVACAPPWTVLPKTEVALGTTYQVELPAGWMRNTANKEVLFISHDGPALQGITIQEATHYEAFKKIKETSTPDILPSELAELTLALVKNEFAASRVFLLENMPALVAGHQGFRLHFKYETSKGLDYEGIITGFATREQVYMIKYYGTSLHYFPRDLPVYDEVVQSFQITGG